MGLSRKNASPSSGELEGVGWKARGDFEVPHPLTNFFPRIRHAIYLIPAVIRICLYTFRQWLCGREAFIDIFNPIKSYDYCGVPIGGIGSGSIGTDFRGGFGRFSLIPGMKEQNQKNVKADQFILTVHSTDGCLLHETLLSSAHFPSSSPLSSWNRFCQKDNVRYRGLYPFAWREFAFPELELTLVCEQFSPIFPHNYEDVSLPLAHFTWYIKNESSQDYRISITFTFRNGTGNKKWSREGLCRSSIIELDDSKGMLLEHSIAGMPLTYGISCKQEQKNITTEDFDPTKDGSTIYHQLAKYGNLGRNAMLQSNDELAIAVNSSFTVTRKNEQNAEFLLIWHMPTIYFPKKTLEYKRRYTRLTGIGNDACSKMMKIAWERKDEWKRKIEDWQKPIIEDNLLPEWYRSALFNELYYLTDGCSIWVEYDAKWRMNESSLSDCSASVFSSYGRFAYLESWEYFMYNTYDVHFYAAWALTVNWPMIELSIETDFCDQVERIDARMERSMCEGKKMHVKKFARIPHDMGHPFDEPWLHTNAYLLHDTSDWKDLNMKFIISCNRVYNLILKSDTYLSSEQKKSLLSHFYDRAALLMEKSLQAWDRDGDGIIENEGIADQTYDVWKMDGTSAYCGSLFLASLASLGCLAEELGRDEDAKQYRELLTTAKEIFVKKLWNGRYFNFDESDATRGVVMSDQLVGIWILTMLGQERIIEDKKILSTLRTIYDYNVCRYNDGRCGAVNGMKEDGQIDDSSIQSEEMWTGTTYGLASFMMSMGLSAECFTTAAGVYGSCWNRHGLQYQTPEAICVGNEQYRAVGYMRPLSIWAIQHAIEQAAKSSY